MELSFFPTNKHILLERIEEKKEINKKKSVILIPEECEKEKIKEYGIYKAKKIALDCIQKSFKERIVVVLNHLVQEIIVEDKKYLIVPEQGVVGFFLEE